MSPELQKIIALLQTQIGYSAQGGGYTKFGDWYGKTVEFDSDYSTQPWCDMFLSWAAHQLGYGNWFGQFSYTVDHAKWFISHGAWGTTPEPGALVFFDWGGSGVVDNIDHIGIVTAVDGKVIHTIEGNVDGSRVKKKIRDESFVVGYGYPDKVKAQIDTMGPAKTTSFMDSSPATGTAPPEREAATPLSLAAAQSALPATSTMAAGIPPASGAVQLASPLSAPCHVVALLLAALILIAYFKVQRASVRLARMAGRRGGGGRSRPPGTSCRGPA